MPQPPFDLLIVTAANATQAAGYSAQLDARENAGRMPAVRRWLVLADPHDQRVGSGAATILALLHAARLFAEHTPKARGLRGLFAGRRVLVLHSGGDSRRLPAYAAQGKLFAPLPCQTASGHPSDLFDLLLDDLHAIPLAKSGRVLVAAGDLLLNLREDPPDVNAPGVVGVASPQGYERASRHGVYVADRRGRVLDFLQKPSLKLARSRDAIRKDGRLLVDTGLVSLDPPTAAAWLGGCGARLSKSGGPEVGPASLLHEMQTARAPQIDLYEHLLMALVPGTTKKDYLSAVTGAAAEQAALGAVFDAVRGPAFQVAVSARCDFIHLGSTREYLGVVRSPPMCSPAPSAGAALIFNCDGDLRTTAAAEGPVVIESCIAPPEGLRIKAPGGNLIVGLPELSELAQHPIDLPRDVGFVCLPIGDQDWTVVVFGTADDAKTPMDKGGTFVNKPLMAFTKANALGLEVLWPGDTPQILWTAALWTVGDLRAGLANAMDLARGRVPERAWRDADRASLAELMPRVNHTRLIAHRDEARRRGFLRGCARRMEADEWLPSRPLVEGLRSRDEAVLVCGGLIHQSRLACSHVLLARMARLYDMLAERFPPRWEPAQGTTLRPGAALEHVKAAAGAEPEFLGKPPRAAILPDQIVWVTTPVRIDLAGGWSDTPPICGELGGAVVNAAITLNGQYPVQVIAKLRDDGLVRINSIDLGNATEISGTDHGGFGDPHDWAALPKAALTLCGVIPRSPKADFSAWIRAFGGGLDLTIFAALPKGSGLGTSSILGAAILAAIDRVLGREPDVPSLVRRTSMLEQMMSTAGGWQDQAGGITPGVKFLTTGPGPLQVPRVRPLKLPPGLTERSLLYYTGLRRLARDILQNVVNRYLERDPACVATIHRLREGAAAMHAALKRGDSEAFVRNLAEYGALKRAIDPGSTNARIEAMVRPVEKHLSAYELPGAGGGGFLFMVAKDAARAAKVRGVLTARPPNEAARFFDFALDTSGLEIRVL